MLYIYNGLMFSIYEVSRKLPILTFVNDDSRFLELRMRYEDSRKKLLSIITEKGVTTEDRQKLMLLVTKTFDRLFLDIAEDTYKVYV
jgi:hypothetical protein